jgi:hypothetical protein
MIKQGIWAQFTYFKNHRYFSNFLHIPIALHRTFSNHLELCFYDQNWPTYEARGNGFSNFLFRPKKAASPRLLQTAIILIPSSFISFSSSMSSAHALQGLPSKTMHRSGRRTFHRATILIVQWIKPGYITLFQFSLFRGYIDAAYRRIRLELSKRFT